MKKLFLLFAAVTLLVGVQACKQKEEAATEATTEAVTTEEPVVMPGDSTTVASEDDTSGRGIKNPTEPAK